MAKRSKVEYELARMTEERDHWRNLAHQYKRELDKQAFKVNAFGDGLDRQLDSLLDRCEKAEGERDQVQAKYEGVLRSISNLLHAWSYDLEDRATQENQQAADIQAALDQSREGRKLEAKVKYLLSETDHVTNVYSDLFKGLAAEKISAVPIHMTEDGKRMFQVRDDPENVLFYLTALVGWVMVRTIRGVFRDTALRSIGDPEDPPITANVVFDLFKDRKPGDPPVDERLGDYIPEEFLATLPMRPARGPTLVRRLNQLYDTDGTYRTDTQGYRARLWWEHIKKARLLPAPKPVPPSEDES